MPTMPINARYDYSFTFLSEYHLQDLKYSQGWDFVDDLEYKIYLNKNSERYSFKADTVGIIEGIFTGSDMLIRMHIYITYDEVKILKKKTKPVEFIKIS
jgi:hypothetical protein